MSHTPVSYVEYTSVAGVRAHTITFPFLLQAHVQATIDAIPETDFTINSAGTTLTFGAGVPAPGGEAIKIFRVTPNTSAGRLVDFSIGAALTESDLDTSALQNLFVAGEALDKANDAFDLVDSIAVLSGNLPVVTGGDNNSGLFVNAGDWATRTPPQSIAHLGLTPRATTAFTEAVYTCLLTTGIVTNSIVALWNEDSGSKNTPVTLVSLGGTDVSISSNDLLLAAGNYKITLEAVANNVSATDAALPEIWVTDDTDGPGQVIYIQSTRGLVDLSAATHRGDYRVNATFSLVLGAPGKISIRTNNFKAVGNCQIVPPSRIVIERLRP